MLFMPVIHAAVVIHKLRGNLPEVLCKNVGAFSGKYTWWGPLFIKVPNEKLQLTNIAPRLPITRVFLSILRNFQNSYVREYLGTADCHLIDKKTSFFHALF